MGRCNNCSVLLEVLPVVSCGHCHPNMVSTIVKQINCIQHFTILYLNHAITNFAEKLASKLPGDLKVVFSTNSRTKANELVVMVARLYIGSHEIISLRNGYHGNAAGTMGAIVQCNWKFNVIQGMGGIIKLPTIYLPDVNTSIKKVGSLCIADEVQAGVHMYWRPKLFKF